MIVECTGFFRAPGFQIPRSLWPLRSLAQIGGPQAMNALAAARQALTELNRGEVTEILLNQLASASPLSEGGAGPRIGQSRSKRSCPEIS